MKKQLLTLAAIAITNLALAQSDLPKIEGDTLYSSSGYKIGKGQDLKIGTGTMTDGDFKYIRINSGSLLKYTSTAGYQGLANQANSLPRSRSGQSLKVIKVEARGNKKRGYNYFVVLGGAARYEVDVENAIATGEVVVPAEFTPKNKSNVTMQSTLSPAEELKRFKSLLDDGTITQEEFDAKKKQILGL